MLMPHKPHNVCVCEISRVQFFETPRTVGLQAPMSMEFSRQEYWNGLPFPTPGDLPNLGIEPESLALAGRSFTTEPSGKHQNTMHWLESEPRSIAWKAAMFTTRPPILHILVYFTKNCVSEIQLGTSAQRLSFWHHHLLLWWFEQ